MNSYDIVITGTIEIGGTYQADTVEEAIALATLELRPQGEIINVTTERAVYLDPNVLDDQ